MWARRAKSMSPRGAGGELSGVGTVLPSVRRLFGGAAIAVSLAAIFPPKAIGAEVASDSPTNYTTATWTNGANMGSGFGPWQFSAEIPPEIPRSEIFNVEPDNFSPDTSWNVTAPVDGTAGAFRNFGALGVGDDIFVRFKIDAVTDLAARVGFRLYQGTSPLYFLQYEDENNSWNLNNTQSWTSANPLHVTEFTWGRDSEDTCRIVFKYNGATIISISEMPWSNPYPDRIEVFSEFQGIDSGGISVAEIGAPAIPDPRISLLLLAACGVFSARAAAKMRKRGWGPR